MEPSRAYIPLQAGQLVALDRETGATEWSADVATSWPPLVHDGVVYVAGDGHLHALSGTSGAAVWSVALDIGLKSPLAFQDGVLVALLDTGEVRALRSSDGQVLWTRTLTAEAGPASLTTDPTSVWLSRGGRLTRLALADGMVLWERELPGTLSPPTVAGDRLIVGSTDNTLYAFDRETGDLAWPRWRSGGDVVGATADDRFVYVASLDNLLRALQRGSGNQAWKRELTTRTTAPPLTFGGIVVVSGNDPTLSTFDARTGAPIGTLSVTADLQGALLIDPDLKPFRVAMIAVTRDGRAIGLRPVGVMFREPPLTPLAALPGRALQREPRVR